MFIRMTYSTLRFANQIIKKYYVNFRFLIFAITGILIIYFYPNQTNFKYDYRKNKPWLHSDLIAPFDFSINKAESDLKLERDIVKQKTIPYYSYDSAVTMNKRMELIVGLNECKANKTPIEVSDIQMLQYLAIMDSVFEAGIIQSPINDNSHFKNPQLQLVRNSQVELVQRDHFFTIVSADKYIQNQLEQKRVTNVEKVKSFLESFLIHNIIFDESTTNKELKLSLDNISTTYGLIQKGERIVSKGELVSTEKYQIIHSLETLYKEDKNIRLGGFWASLGKTLLVLIILFILYFYVYLFDKKVFHRLKRLALLSTVVVTMVVPAFILYSSFPDYFLAFPFCIFAISNKVFFSSRVSILSYILSIILIGSIVSGGFEFVFTQVIVGLAAILSLKSLYRRAQFLTTALTVWVLYIAIHLIRTMILDNGFDFLNTNQMWMYTISAFLTLLTYPYLFVLEKTFRLVTDFTLLELSNTNLPLLRQLATKAPGTFLHSVLVSNIAEEVTHKINGNILLVRAGALYHDIGKLSNPSFFIENQHGINPHDEIPAGESAAIIINHVAEGVKLARKHKLPDEVIGFIRTHHGTQKTSYFHNKEMIDNPGKDINEGLFTYLGPRPRSKEEAVMMLADIFEAATRSMKTHTRENISEFVENMVDQLILNHQFNDANITFNDLKIIKETFKTQLINIYHKRIEYPKLK